jgi:PAS domain S-box-containing protein
MGDHHATFLKHHSGIEQALVEVSRLLVSSGQADLREVLRIVGEAVGAACAYLVTVPDDAPLDDASIPTGSVTRWHRDGGESERRLFDGGHSLSEPAMRLLAQARYPEAKQSPIHERLSEREQAGLAIPLLSRQDRFIGYLGIEHAALSDDDLRDHGRVLSVFGDLLAGYLSRARAEQALSESEERWRKFVEFNPEAILVVSDDAILYANEACARLFGFQDALDLRSHALRDFLPADQFETVEQQQAEYAHQPAYTPFEHEIIRLNGEERVVETVAVGVPFEGVEAVQMVLRDITDRKRSEERYRNFVQTISEGVWRIDLSEPISALALPSLQAERILDQGYLAECNTMMTRLFGAARTEAIVGQPIRVLVPALDRRLLHTFIEEGYRLHNHELTVQRKGESPRHFALNAVGRIERGALVRVWGSCVEVTERVEMERRMVAVLEEQQERIGRDLHDSVGQLLTGIRMLSENLAARHFAPSDDGFAATKKVTSFAEEALQRVREICRGLVPPQLYQEGLASALRALAANMDVLSDVRCTFTHQGEGDIEDYDVKLQLYRMAQEAINNALKHAQPNHVWIRLIHTAESFVLEVEDDGTGFDVDASTGKSLGLYGMKRRASSVRAGLSIDSESGVGTMVRVTLPTHRLLEG